MIFNFKSKERRLQELFSRVDGKRITLHAKEHKIKTSYNEIMDLMHEYLQAHREDRTPEHRLIEAGFAEAAAEKEAEGIVRTVKAVISSYNENS